MMSADMPSRGTSYLDGDELSGFLDMLLRKHETARRRQSSGEQSVGYLQALRRTASVKQRRHSHDGKIARNRASPISPGKPCRVWEPFEDLARFRTLPVCGLIKPSDSISISISPAQRLKTPDEISSAKTGVQDSILKRDRHSIRARSRNDANDGSWQGRLWDFRSLHVPGAPNNVDEGLSPKAMQISGEKLREWPNCAHSQCQSPNKYKADRGRRALGEASLEEKTKSFKAEKGSSAEKAIPAGEKGSGRAEKLSFIGVSLVGEFASLDDSAAAPRSREALTGPKGHPLQPHMRKLASRIAAETFAPLCSPPPLQKTEAQTRSPKDELCAVSTHQRVSRDDAFRPDLAGKQPEIGVFKKNRANPVLPGTSAHACGFRIEAHHPRSLSTEQRESRLHGRNSNALQADINGFRLQDDITGWDIDPLSPMRLPLSPNREHAPPSSAPGGRLFSPLVWKRPSEAHV